MADLDEVRAAMGYDRINIFGASYGTRAAQVYMRQYPDHVRTVIMKGVTPMAVPLTLPMAKDAQKAWNRLSDDCASDPVCQKAFPNIGEEFKAVFERLEKGVETEVLIANGKKEKVRITRAAIAPTIRTFLQSVDSGAELPMLIHAAFQGNYSPLAQATLSIRKGFPKSVSIGVFLAITCIEDVGISDEKEVARESEGTFLRDDYFKQLQRVAAILPRKKMPPEYRKPIKSDIPTVLISGYLDPAAPPNGGEDVARDLSRSSHIVVRHGSHSYDGLSGCLDPIMSTFIGSGSVEGINISCVDLIKSPPFVVVGKK